MLERLDPKSVPAEVRAVVERLERAGHRAYVVGGCVRDQLLGQAAHDWDVATSALPEQVMALFAHVIPVGVEFGTVSVRDGIADGAPGIETTTFRRDLPYRDGRRPEGVLFAESIEEDLARRDFTINALAWDLVRGRLIDPHDGLADLRAGVVRAVGDPRARLREDALRMLRAVRFAARFDFVLDEGTARAIEADAPRVRLLSGERVRDELLKMLAGPNPATALWMLHELGLLFEVLPELKPTEALPQAKKGHPHLLSHLIACCEAVAPGDPVLRLTALLHDVGKVETRALQPSGQVTFHGHEQVGAEIAGHICRRLRLGTAPSARVASLIGMHMVSGDEVGAKAIRRWVGRYGEDWVRDLLALRRADHIASGHRGQNPWADRMEAELGQVMAEAGALHVRDLAIGGHDVMEALGIPPGPAVGAALDWLLDAVLDDPVLNERTALLARLAEWPGSPARAGEPESAGK
ncbi:MAG TPA: CCA tRNA nucleotidyltransferase [Limnochordia bacterium]|nr:CCA tRNA nucleotidyltransferase [Limnochordia bacterium]